MVSLALLLTGLATVCWPCAVARARVRGLRPGGAADRRASVRHTPTRWPRPGPLPLLAGTGAAGWLLAGAAGAAAAVLCGATALRRWRASRRARRSLAVADALAEAVRSLVAGLRAGAPAAVAAEHAAADADHRVADTMLTVAATARLGGDPDRALDGIRAEHPALTGTLRRLATAWTLAARHGLPLADVLESVGGDLDRRLRFARQVHARMAGPRASAAMLALLPVLGIGLGEAMGARPLHVLTATGAGQVLLLTGAVLLCAGIAWSGRLTERVVLR